MPIRKTLGTIVLASAIGLIGCGYDPQYIFNGNIGEEYIEFSENVTGDVNILRVVRADRREIVYKDVNDDFKVDIVYITTINGTTERYSEGELGDPILSEAQKQFDRYLENIINHKQQEGLKNLRE